MHLYTDMVTHTYICTYMHMYVYKHVQIFKCAATKHMRESLTNLSTNVCGRACLHTCMCMCACVCVCVYVYLRKCTCVYIYTYIDHSFKNVTIHIYTYLLLSRCTGREPSCRWPSDVKKVTFAALGGCKMAPEPSLKAASARPLA